MNNKLTKFFGVWIFLYSFLSLASQKEFYYSNKGYCQICEKQVNFESKNKWFRDHYLCPFCKSKPRERALLYMLEKIHPEYRNLIIHESSPCFRATSLKLKKICKNYTYSYYIEGTQSGDYLQSYKCTCQDLRKTTFGNNTFDIMITQDVMEHVFELEKIFEEIARILKVGGSHIFTTPMINKNKTTIKRAELLNGKVIYLLPPNYHGSPVDKSGSLVTYDFRYDISKFCPKNCYFTIFFIEDKYYGLEKTEYNEVCIMTKFKD